MDEKLPSVVKDNLPKESQKGKTDVEVKDPVSAVAGAAAEACVGIVHETFSMITGIVQRNNERRVAIAQIEAELDKALATIDANLKRELKKIDDAGKFRLKALESLNSMVQSQLNSSDISPEMKVSILNAFMDKITNLMLKV